MTVALQIIVLAVAITIFFFGAALLVLLITHIHHKVLITHIHHSERRSKDKRILEHQERMAAQNGRPRSDNVLEISPREKP